MSEPTNGPIENSVETQHESSAPNKEAWLTMPVAIVIAGVVIAGAVMLTKMPAPDAAPAGQAAAAITADTLRPASATDHIIGSPDAPVVMVEYADFQCPYCGVIYPTLKRIVEESNGQVAWVYRHLPLESIHPEARPSALAAECLSAQLGDQAFWRFMEDAFANQQNLGSAWYAAEAVKLGANMSQFNSCMTNKTFDSRIDADLAEAIQLGGNGTPYTIIVPKEGRAVPFSGALPYSQIKAIVNSVVSKTGVQPSQ